MSEIEIIVDGYAAPLNPDPDARIGDADGRDMELGNAIFGNSRGRYAVPRGAGFEEELARLTERVGAATSPLGNRYPEDFENETFAVRGYYWGDCACGYEDREEAWSATHSHSTNCYQSELRPRMEAIRARHEPIIDAAIGKRSEYPMWSAPPSVQAAIKAASGARRAEEDATYAELRAKHGDLPAYGCAIHCTCDHEREWKEWAMANGHADACPLVLPNFHHKATDFRLDWYKYPLRDSYANRSLTLREFAQIIDSCVTSLTDIRVKE